MESLKGSLYERAMRAFRADIDIVLSGKPICEFDASQYSSEVNTKNQHIFG